MFEWLKEVHKSLNEIPTPKGVLDKVNCIRKNPESDDLTGYEMPNGFPFRLSDLQNPEFVKNLKTNLVRNRTEFVLESVNLNSAKAWYLHSCWAFVYTNSTDPETFYITWKSIERFDHR